MACSRCAESAASGAPVCGFCGEPLGRPELFATQEPPRLGGCLVAAFLSCAILLIVFGACLATLYR